MQGNNPYQPPESSLETTADLSNVEYVGLWKRFVANFVDGFLMAIVFVPLALFIAPDTVELGTMNETNSGFDYLFSLMQMLIVIIFWIYKSATPGKMLMSAYIVDAKTGGKPSAGQFVVRYLMYFVSAVVLFLGFIWIIFDSRKQGWHDKIAGTVVIRKQ
ncbi:RDD family protein [Thioflexithrix psekupsensis]|uniref:RDD domain-containing protein n=1 Tax=Thioflexithrix psekupsensis TaxID=1570016 RepID=A0A251X8V8_9GAMM|nr:RDD family protein [Thioflexithrix psekupsensis]OUD13962.1 hypothetical protein TPSD3_06355 [Thioflexithrix psekupsensis]